MVVTSPLEHNLKSLRIFCGLFLVLLPVISTAELYVVIIEGLGGDVVYTEQFSTQVAAVSEASKTLTTDDRVHVFPAQSATREDILDYFTTLASRITESDRLAVYLIGHGSYDDYEYKFNIAGPDLSGGDLAEALNELPGDNQLVVNTSSASGALADALMNDERMLILATRSGVERHATKFGNYFAEALSDSGADLDKNQVVSAGEAYRFAERQVDDYFERNGQLATEHSRMEGDRADQFSLARLGDSRPSQDDDALTDLVARRYFLNGRLDELRLSRDEMTVDDYQSTLLQLLLELAQTENEIEAREKELGREN
jgi:hypothetical protein